MKGFTLLETVIAAGVALIVGVLLIGILVNQSGLSSKENAIVNEGLSLNDAMAKINSSIKEAAGVVSGYPEGSPIYTTSPSVLVLKLPATNVSGTIDNVYDYLVISADLGNSKILRLQNFPDAQSGRPSENIVLTTLLNSIQFSYLDKSGNSVTSTSASKISVSLAVLSQSGSIGSGRTSVSTTTLRNSSP